MAIAQVTSVTRATEGTTASVDTTGATLLTVCVSSYNVINNPTVSDSKGNTYTGLTNYGPAAAANNARIFYCENPTVGSGHTFTVTGPTIVASFICQAWSGVKTSGAFDQKNGNGSGSGTTGQPGSVTPTEDNELVLAMVSLAASSASETVSSPFSTPIIIDYTGANFGTVTAYDIQTTATARNPTFTGSSNTRALAIATFRTAVAASGQPTMRRFGGVDNANFRCGSEGVKMWRVQPRPSGLLIPDRSLVIPQPEMRLAN